MRTETEAARAGRRSGGCPSPRPGQLPHVQRARWPQKAHHPRDQLAAEPSCAACLWNFGPPCHIGTMTIYTVSASADHAGFDVEISGDDGAYQTTLGFANEVAANNWVAHAKGLAKSWMPGRDREKSWRH
jgi:hypothetical protein